MSWLEDYILVRFYGGQEKAESLSESNKVDKLAIGGQKVKTDKEEDYSWLHG